MKIMESRVKSIIREEVGRAIRSRLLREADPDYPYKPDEESNKAARAFYARGESPEEAAAERAMAGVGDEGDDEGDDTDADRGRDDEALAARLPYREGGYGYDFEVLDAFNRMKLKPMDGIIIDNRGGESPGGEYPVYEIVAGEIGFVPENQIAAIFASAFLTLIAEDKMPPGFYLASSYEDGPLEIINSA